MDIRTLGLLVVGGGVHRGLEWAAWETYQGAEDRPRVEFLSRALPVGLGFTLATFGKSSMWQTMGAGVMASAVSAWFGNKLGS